LQCAEGTLVGIAGVCCFYLEGAIGFLNVKMFLQIFALAMRLNDTPTWEGRKNVFVIREGLFKLKTY
jgi:hypothetical protein